MGDEFQLIHAAAVDREVQAETEEAFLAHLELVAHFLGVEDGGLLARIPHAAFISIDLDAGLEVGDLFTQVFQHHLALHRVDVETHVHHFVEVDHTAQPAGVDLARVAVHVVGSGVAGAELEVGVLKLQRTRCHEVAQGGDALLECRLDFLFFPGPLGLGDSHGVELGLLAPTKHQQTPPETSVNCSPFTIDHTFTVNH